MRRLATELFDGLGFHLPLDAKVGELSRAQKQMIEIAKGLRHEAKILILDEPTASLTDGEAEKLFEDHLRVPPLGRDPEALGPSDHSARRKKGRDRRDRVDARR